jgi:hypothetical protein
MNLNKYNYIIYIKAFCHPGLPSENLIKGAKQFTQLNIIGSSNAKTNTPSKLFIERFFISNIKNNYIINYYFDFVQINYARHNTQWVNTY